MGLSYVHFSTHNSPSLKKQLWQTALKKKKNPNRETELLQCRLMAGVFPHPPPPPSPSSICKLTVPARFCRARRQNATREPPSQKFTAEGICMLKGRNLAAVFLGSVAEP